MKILQKITLLLLVIFLYSCGSTNAEIKALEKAEIFSISKDKKSIILNGAINSSALKEFKKLNNLNPNITYLEIINCEGSINDEINLKLAKYIHDNNFNIHLKDYGIVASGGTDLFLAGKKRTKGKNTKIGVHSWAGDDVTATDFPLGHSNHLPYIKYYKSIGLTNDSAKAFYYFTINAASANNIHWMTEEEIRKYKILKQ